jgi:hypothetical protein
VASQFGNRAVTGRYWDFRTLFFPSVSECRFSFGKKSGVKETCLFGARAFQHVVRITFGPSLPRFAAFLLERKAA